MPSDDQWLPPGAVEGMRMAEWSRQQQRENEQWTREFEADLAEQRAAEAAEDARKERREKFRSRLAVTALIIAVLSLGLGITNMLIALSAP